MYNFDDLEGEISNKNVRDKLQVLYGSVNHIDVWVDCTLEDQVEGEKVGPLAPTSNQCHLVEHFKYLRDGGVL